LGDNFEATPGEKILEKSKQDDSSADKSKSLMTQMKLLGDESIMPNTNRTGTRELTFDMV
jgi:hypothetical protein